MTIRTGRGTHSAHMHLNKQANFSDMFPHTSFNLISISPLSVSACVAENENSLYENSNKHQQCACKRTKKSAGCCVNARRVVFINACLHALGLE
jgi:hypothetical protein